MTDLAGQPTLRGFTNALAAFVAVLLLPMLSTFWFRYSALHNDESGRTARWITYRRWNHIVVLGTVAAWWGLWDLQRQSALIPTLAQHLSWIDPALVTSFFFWVPPVAMIAAVQLICYSLDRAIVGRRWTTSDVLRLACWRTVSPTIAFLFVAAGFAAIYDKKLTGILWLVAAAILALVGTIRLRSAEGMKMQRVKSGELCKRAFVIAKRMTTNLKRVYVVPAGRGDLTNAYGLWQGVALTDNYGKFLNRAQLDFVIGHELSHVKHGHGRKKLLIMVAVYATMALLCFIMPSALFRFRPLINIFVVLVPILAFYSLSRRFEYIADKTAVEFTHDPEVAIHALANLYRITQAPTYCDRFTELFMSHPAFTRRVCAIGETGRMRAERVLEVIRDTHLRGAVSDELWQQSPIPDCEFPGWKTSEV
jgi:Zn-dependent protease with chaperone function